jgi:uncharacterized repeat protein (TIGR01451 family)
VYAAVFLLGAVLVVGYGRLRGQGAAPADSPPARPPAQVKPGPWAPFQDAAPARHPFEPTATPLPPGNAGPRTVIASSRPQQPPAVNENVAVPNDGLVPPPVGPAAPGASGLRQAGFRPEQETEPARTEPAPAPPPAPPPKPEDSAAVRVLSSGMGTPAAPSAVSGSLLAVEVVGPGQVAPDQPLPYEIMVRNPGAVVVGRVRVEDVLPAGARLLWSEPAAEVQGERIAWNLGNLEAGGERRVRVEIQPTGQGELLLSPSATFTAAVGCRTRVVRPPFAVTVQTAETAQRGSAVLFQIQVTNHGPNTLNRVVLRAHLSPGLQHPQGNEVATELGNLGPGEMRVVPLETVAAQPGRLIVEAEAAAEGSMQARSRAGVLVTEPALSLRLAWPDGLRQAVPGRDVDLRLEVANPGPQAAANVRLVQTVPEGLEFVGASTGGVLDAATKNIVWSLGTLGPGQAQTLMLRLRPRSAGDWTTQGVATADRLAEARAQQSLHVEGAPSLSLEVVGRDDPLEVGAETVYEVRVVNQGSAASPNVRLTAQVPEGLLPVRAEPAARIQQGQVAFDPLPQLQPQHAILYRIRVRGQRSGDWRFQADLSADHLQRPIHEEVSARVYPQDSGHGAGVGRGN